MLTGSSSPTVVPLGHFCHDSASHAPQEESSAQDAGAGLIQEPASVDESVDKFGLSFESFMRGVKTQAESKCRISLNFSFYLVHKKA